jgi:hypothetical protein
MKTKTHKVDGHDVEVAMEKVEHSGHSLAIRFTAKAGDAVHVHHHTIGAESGEMADYTAESLQAELDEVGKSVAAAALKRHRVHKLFEQI